MANKRLVDHDFFVTIGEDRAADLARRLAKVSDAEMKHRYVRSEVRVLDAAGLFDCLSALVHGVQRDRQLVELLLSVSVAVRAEVSDDKRRGAARLAAERGDAIVAGMLAPSPLRALEREPKIPDFGMGRPLTLGERKTLARRRDRNLLARVLQDPDPAVIEILLRNPAITEADVIRLCARRPIRPDVLERVFEDLKWIVRYPVQRALIQNPYCPLDMALLLTPHLNAQDAKEISNAPDQRPIVREASHRFAQRPQLH